ncbi:hypothetical protein ACFO1B_15710 [Dactylosporangium siamense]|uniref:hypothetical protein n=1 Tax=Dactylosporangium siamense TaxID=685454 RepID=UPI00361C06AA
MTSSDNAGRPELGPLGAALLGFTKQAIVAVAAASAAASAERKLPACRLAVLDAGPGAGAAFAALTDGISGLALRPGAVTGTTVFAVDGTAELSLTRDTLTEADLLSPADEVEQRLRSADGYLVCLDAARLAGPGGVTYLRPVLVNLQHALAGRPAGAGVPVTFVLASSDAAVPGGAVERLRPFLTGVAGDRRVAALVVTVEPHRGRLDEAGRTRVAAGLLWALRHWLTPADPAPTEPAAGGGAMLPGHPALLATAAGVALLSTPVGLVAAGAVAYAAARRRRNLAEAAAAAETAAQEQHHHAWALVERLDQALDAVVHDAPGPGPSRQKEADR